MQQQVRQRHHVLEVVLQHPPQQAGIAAAQVLQPRAGRFRTGEVVFAHDTERAAFDGRQPAVLPDAAVAAARGEQQVEVLDAGQRRALPRQPIACGQQRRVVLKIDLRPRL